MSPARSSRDQAGDWEEIRPVLDSAVAGLGRRDRDAVLLRFYQGLSHAEVGSAMGLSEDAAKKRVQRALERLRGAMESKGVTISAGGLAVMVGAKVTTAAPAGLAEAAIGAAGGGGAGAAGVVAKGAIKLMAWAKLKVAALIVASVATAGLGGGAAVLALANGEGPAKQQHVTGETPTDRPEVLDKRQPAAADAAGVSTKDITGVVVLPDGKPAAGADIYLPPAPGALLDLEDQVSRLGHHGPTSRPVARVRTWANGRFSLAPQEGFVGLAVVHADGFAQVSAEDLSKSDRVVLQPWSRITGQISQPLRSEAAQKAIYFSDRRDPFSRFQLSYSVEATVDAQGTFVLDHIPPGHGVVARDMPLTREMTEMHFWDHGVPVTVDPGRTAEVQIGGSGVMVTGRLQPPAGSNWRLADTYAYVQLRPVPGKIESPKSPADLDRKDPAEVKAWYEQWVKTPEAKVWLAAYQAYEDTFKVSYANGIGGDGVFQVQEVPPGRYELTINVAALNHGPSWGGGAGLARLHREVVVQPDAGDGRKADLGELKLESPPYSDPVTQPAGTGR